MAVTNATEATPSKEQEAKDLFDKKEYERCLQALDQLVVGAGKDAKLLHNRALADFYQGGAKDAQRLQRALQACQARCDELARAAEAELDGALSPSSGASNQDSFVADGGHRNSEPYCWDYQSAVLSYNQALLHYQQHQYPQAAALLEPIYTDLEPVDEDVALRVCLLLLDVHLANREPAKAANVLTFLERLFSLYFPATRLRASSRDERPRSRSKNGERDSSADQGEDADPATRPGTPADASSLEGGHSRHASEDAGDDETRMAPNRGRNGTGAEGLAGFSKPLPIGAEDLKLRLHLARVRLLLLIRNLKSSKRELKAALGLSQEHAQALNLKAQLECGRGNYRKAIKLLVNTHKPDARNPQSSRAAFLANLGTVHHFLGKRHLARLYFSKALAEEPGSLAERAQTDSGAVLYSAGLEQLAAGDPAAAVKCFQQVGGDSALRWLRLGEAFVAALSRGVLAPETDGNKKEDGRLYGDVSVRVSASGEGPWRRVTVDNERNGRAEGGESSRSGGCEDASSDGLSLRYARECFEKVLGLLEGSQAQWEGAGVATGIDRGGGQPSSSRRIANGIAEDSNGASAHKRKGSEKAGPLAVTIENGVGPGEGGRAPSRAPLVSLSQATQEPGLRPVVLSSSLKAGLVAHDAELKQQKEVVRQSAVLGLAYVDLLLGNPAGALANVESLMQTPIIGRANSLLGRAYAAEALCSLGRSEEATHHLSVALTELTASSSEPLSPVPEQGPVQDKEQVAAAAVGKPRDVQAELTGPGARAALYVNLASVHAMKGELVEARRCLSRASQIAQDNPPVLLAGVLIQMEKVGRGEASGTLEEGRTPLDSVHKRT